MALYTLSVQFNSAESVQYLRTFVNVMSELMRGVPNFFGFTNVVAA